jgi:hypothetical protein
MKTIYNWLSDINAAEKLVYPDLPLCQTARKNTAAPALDGIFVLGKGFVHYGNTPVGFFQDKALEKNPGLKWAIGDTPHGSLLLLFLLLSSAASGVAGAWLDPMAYWKSFSVEKCALGE